jgi:methionyl-tRNA formyltransferase
MKRVLFMGTPQYATAILQSLYDAPDIEVVGVYTQPDKPVGRKAVLTPPGVKVLAQTYNTPVYQPNRLRDIETIHEVLDIACDVIIVAAYGQILPKAILDYVPCINLHASILPSYRGASPIQQSLLNNDKQSGVTAMWMDEGLDTGAIIEIATLDIAADEMVETLYDRLTACASVLTLKVLREWNYKTVVEQNEAQATHCKKITKLDGLIDFTHASEIFNRYRAFTPWPGIYLESGLKIKKMILEESSATGNQGEIIRIDKESIVVSCAQGTLRLFTLQAPSRGEVTAVEYLNAKRLVCGHILA